MIALTGNRESKVIDGGGGEDEYLLESARKGGQLRMSR